MSTVNIKLHQVVVILNNDAFGFTSLGSAVGFIQEAFIDKDSSQILELITTALSDDPENNLKIMPVDVYEDIYLEDEYEDEDEDGYTGTDIDED